MISTPNSFAVSLISLPSSSTDDDTGITPVFSITLVTSGDATAAATCLFKVSSSGFGVPAAAILVEPLRPQLDVITVEGKACGNIWKSIGFVLRHPQLRVLGCSAFVFVIAQHTFTFYLVTYLYEHCGLSIARAGFLLFLSQIVGSVVRLLSGGMSDRMPRMKLLGWTGVGMAVCLAQLVMNGVARIAAETSNCVRIPGLPFDCGIVRR